MTDDALIDAYDECLKALEAGADLGEVVARYPHLADELRPLLEMATTLQILAAAPAAPRSVEMADRAQFLAQAAERLRPPPPVRGVPGRAGWGRRAFSLVALVVIALGGSYSAITVSAQSLPGDTLYSLKRSIEDVRLLLAADAQERTELETEFEERRLEEVYALTGQQRTATIEFKGTLNGLGPTEWVINTIRVRVTSATRISGTPRLGAWAEVHGMLQSDGTILAAEISLENDEPEDEESPTRPAPSLTVTQRVLPSATPSRRVTVTPSASVVVPLYETTPTLSPSLSPSPILETSTPVPAATSAPTETPIPTSTQAGDDEEVEFSGVIEALTADVWRISGQEVWITADTDIHGAPPAIGLRVKVHALRLSDGRLAAREIEVHDDSEEEDHSPNPSPTPAP